MTTERRKRLLALLCGQSTAGRVGRVASFVIIVAIAAGFVRYRKQVREFRKQLTASVVTEVKSVNEPTSAPALDAPQMEALIARLTDSDPCEQSKASLELSRAGKCVVPPVINVLGGPDARARWWAATTLGEVGPDSAEVLPTIIIRLEAETESRVKCAIVEALGRIGDAKAVPCLVGLIDHPDDNLRRSCAEALGRLKHAPTEAEAAVSELLLDDDHAVQVAARQALIKMNAESLAARATTRATSR